MSKYHSRKITRDGMTFDSLIEYRRFRELTLLEKAGEITDLKRQVEFELMPSQYEEIPTGEVYKRGERQGQPKMKRVCVELSVKYIADFTYTQNGKQVVEDTKGFRTKDYILKRKMMLYFNGIKIKEVRKNETSKHKSSRKKHTGNRTRNQKQ